MSTHRIVLVGQATSIRQDGEVEFVTHDVSIQPGRHTFANVDDLNTYLGQVLGGQAENGKGIRGSVSRKGTYSRRAADGTQAVTFGDPVLDTITSAAGTLVIGGQTIDFRAGHEALGGTSGTSGGVVAAASDLKFTCMVNGAERWASDDRSLVEYRLGTGRLDFHAWRHTEYLAYWSLGGEISISETNANFQAAAIEPHYYMSATGPCQLVGDWRPAEHLNDNYFDRYQWGIFLSQEPERVAVGCRAIWHNQFFGDIVTAGDGCTNWPNDPFQQGRPADWATIKTLVELNGLWTDGVRNAAISSQFTSISVDMSAFNRPVANGSIVSGSTIKVTFPDDATYTGTLHAPNRISWSNGSVWTKVVNTVIDLNGSWTDGGPRHAVISEGVTSLTIDMSDYDRTAATGSIDDGSTITVTFPDVDAPYTASLQPPNRISWSNGSVWTKV
jgi:hypothetical protein